MANSKKSDLMPFIPATGANLPEFMKKDSGLGSENISNDALETPRLNLLQQLSPQCKKSKAEYVEGAEEGKFFNTVTQELSDEVLCINLYFEKTFVIWRNRKNGGGGYVGQFDTHNEAIKYMTDNDLDPNPDMHNIVETDNHYMLLLDAQGKVKGPAIMNMSSTKLKASRTWNTQLHQLMGDHGVARFATVWKLTSFVQESKDYSWAGMNVEHVGFVDEKLYALAKQSYENVSASKNETVTNAA